MAEGRGIPPGCPGPPSQVGKIAAQAARGVEGVQLSALSHKATLPPLVSFGLSPDQHFERSMEIARRILPTEESVKVDEDLKVVVAMMVTAEVS